MSQYLDQQGLQTLVTKTKEYARKSAKEAVNSSAAGPSKTITGWDTATSAAEYGNIEIAESQVTGLVDDLALKAPLASPVFSGTPTVPYPTNTADGSLEIANVDYVLDVIGNIGEAMHYKGAVTQSEGLPTSGVAGDTWKVAEDGTYAGIVCEVGDMIIANKAFNSAPTSADVDVIQTNIDGAVSGPSSATDGNFVLFDGTTGKVIKNSTVKPSDFKTVQTSAEYAPANSLKTIQKIEQDDNGDIAVTFQDIQTASTSQAGVVQLSSSSASTDEYKAATPKAVKDAYDVLNTAKQDKLAFNGDYDATNNKVATESTVTNAIAALDASPSSIGDTNVQVQVTQVDGLITAVSVTDRTSAAIEDAIDALDVDPITGATSATITSISETDGKINATYSPIQITTDQVTGLDVAIAGKADKVADATSGNLAALDANGNLVDSNKKADDFKTKQTAVPSPEASGNAVAFIDSISQDANGVITPTKKTVYSASDDQDGLMSSEDFTKLSEISTSANYVTIDGSGNLKATDANDEVTTLLSPIYDINSLFTGA